MHPTGDCALSENSLRGSKARWNSQLRSRPCAKAHPIELAGLCYLYDLSCDNPRDGLVALRQIECQQRLMIGGGYRVDFFRIKCEMLHAIDGHWPSDLAPAAIVVR